MVMEKYCNPERTITFAKPTTNIVNAFIMELPQVSGLPACAQSGLSYAVMAEVPRIHPSAFLARPVFQVASAGKRMVLFANQLVSSLCRSAPGMPVFTRRVFATQIEPRSLARR
jgi:hypothetical protein